MVMTPSQLGKYKQLYDMDMSDKEMAKHLHKSESAIRFWRKKMGLPPNLGTRPGRTLTPQGERFFEDLIRNSVMAREAGIRPDVGAFMEEWRQIYGGIKNG